MGSPHGFLRLSTWDLYSLNTLTPAWTTSTTLFSWWAPACSPLLRGTSQDLEIPSKHGHSDVTQLLCCLLVSCVSLAGSQQPGLAASPGSATVSPGPRAVPGPGGHREMIC